MFSKKVRSSSCITEKQVVFAGLLSAIHKVTLNKPHSMHVHFVPYISLTPLLNHPQLVCSFMNANMRYLPQVYMPQQRVRPPGILRCVVLQVVAYNTHTYL